MNLFNRQKRIDTIKFSYIPTMFDPDGERRFFAFRVKEDVSFGLIYINGVLQFDGLYRDYIVYEHAEIKGILFNKAPSKKDRIDLVIAKGE